MSLTADEKLKILRGTMRDLSRRGVTMSDTLKADLAEAIDATDAWIEANQSSFNAALPTVARTNWTTPIKTYIFCVVALGRTGIDYLKQVLGEVD